MDPRPGHDLLAQPTPARGADTSESSQISHRDYERLAQLRAGLRRYLAWAEARAREHDLTPAQYQLALAVLTHADPKGPTLSDLADALLLRHHSVVGLVDRAQDAGLVQRERDDQLGSRVHVTLTRRGSEVVATLSELHLRQLAELAPLMQELWGEFGQDRAPARHERGRG